MSCEFGEYLHMIRKRVKGTQLAKEAGISYVYLLDIEKGARPAPSRAVLMALAEHLSFNEGEEERFFDLAAAESNTIPIDVAEYLLKNRELINALRQMKRKGFDYQTLQSVLDTTIANTEDVKDE